MTQAQWFWEYFALREKEKEQNKLTAETITDSLKALRTILISVLGLNLLPNEKTEDGEEKEVIIPLSLLTGRRDAVELMFKKMNEEEQLNKAIGDEEFERLSMAMAKGEDLGDMEPLVNMTPEEEKNLTEWFNPARTQELKNMGINITDIPHKPVVHIDVDTDSMKERMVEQTKTRYAVDKEIEQKLEKERQELESKGVRVTFDDNG
ncbi:hypothetical protein KAR91_60105 [Candidatus Pacearchaeota archaeon]|nr:hypothetical protein [Candidatus Pacearchaeota archaeon]